MTLSDLTSHDLIRPDLITWPDATGLTSSHDLMLQAWPHHMTWCYKPDLIHITWSSDLITCPDATDLTSSHDLMLQTWPHHMTWCYRPDLVTWPDATDLTSSHDLMLQTWLLVYIPAVCDWPSPYREGSRLWIPQLLVSSFTETLAFQCWDLKARQPSG